jgi:hypothetical protein
MRGVDVHADAAADVLAVARVAPEGLAGGGLVHLDAVLAIALRALVDHEDLQAFARGVELADVQRVAMTEAGAVEQLAAAGDGGGAVHDVLLPVAVDIGDREPVRALAEGRLAAGFRAVEHPALAELAAAPVPGGDHRPRVIAAREHAAGQLTVDSAAQPGGAGQEAVDAVAVAVAPGLALAAALGHIGLAGQQRARAAVEDRDELRTGEHMAALVAVLGHRVAEHPAATVHRAVGRADHQLGAAIAVEVFRHEGRVVRARADVGPQVDAPELAAVEPVGVDQGRRGDTGLRVVLGIRRLPLEHDLERAVAVEVGRRAVVGLVGHAAAVGGDPVGGLLQRDAQQAVRAEAPRRSRCCADRDDPVVADGGVTVQPLGWRLPAARSGAGRPARHESAARRRRRPAVASRRACRRRQPARRPRHDPAPWRWSTEQRAASPRSPPGSRGSPAAVMTHGAAWLRACRRSSRSSGVPTRPARWAGSGRPSTRTRPDRSGSCLPATR